MRQLEAIVLFAALATNSVCGQEAGMSAQANRPPVRVKVYTVAKG